MHFENKGDCFVVNQVFSKHLLNKTVSNSIQFNFEARDWKPLIYKKKLQNNVTYKVFGPMYFLTKEVAIKLNAGQVYINTIIILVNLY